MVSMLTFLFFFFACLKGDLYTVTVIMEGKKGGKKG